MKNSKHVRLPEVKGAPHSWTGAMQATMDGGNRNFRHQRHVVVLPGYGRPEYPFPTTDQLVQRAIAQFSSRPTGFSGRHGQAGTKRGRRRKQAGKLRFQTSAARQAIDGIAETGTDALGPVLRIAAGTLATIIHDGRFKAVIARQFDPYKGACNWALNNMPAKFHAPAASLRDHLLKVEGIYGEAIPRVIKFLSSKYPTAGEDELLDASVSVLNEQLMDILNVLGIWTDNFAQKMYGFYPELEYLHFTVGQANHLYHNGDLESGSDDRLRTRAFHLSDVFMARYSDQGPATIPGGRGPVGAHAIEVPFDEADVLLIYMPLYMHEFRHDFYNDVEGLADEMTVAVAAAIQHADAAGLFTFSKPFVRLGRQRVPTIALLTYVYTQTLSETDADIAGGISLTGEAFMYSMLATFCAFNLRGEDPFELDDMLRSGSYYAIGDDGELALEPHMPDFMRALVVAAALERIGFTDEAELCRRLARQAAGTPVPQFITWRNIDRRSKVRFTIKLAVSDLEQVAPVVVDTIFHAKLRSLGGQSTSDLVNWTPRRKAKVDALVEILISGKSEIPPEVGDIWSTYVAAAAIKAVWTLWKNGIYSPKAAAHFVEGNARKMMDSVRAQFEEKQAASATAAGAQPDAGNS